MTTDIADDLDMNADDEFVLSDLQRAHLKQRAAMAKRILGGRGPHENRMYVISPYPAKDFEPGELLTVTVEPSQRFKLVRIVIPESIGRSFQVEDILIGKDRFTPALPFSALYFADPESDPMTNYLWPDVECPIGRSVGLVVRNVSDSKQMFRVAFMGTVTFDEPSKEEKSCQETR